MDADAAAAQWERRRRSSSSPAAAATPGAPGVARVGPPGTPATVVRRRRPPPIPEQPPPEPEPNFFTWLGSVGEAAGSLIQAVALQHIPQEGVKRPSSVPSRTPSLIVSPPPPTPAARVRRQTPASAPPRGRIPSILPDELPEPLNPAEPLALNQLPLGEEGLYRPPPSQAPSSRPPPSRLPSSRPPSASILPPSRPAPPPVRDWAERVPTNTLHPARLVRKVVASPSLRLWHEELLAIQAMPDFEEKYDAEQQADVAEKLHRARVALDEKEGRISALLVGLGALHGAYVGIVSSLLSLFTPQICPPTAAHPAYHSCTSGECARNLSPFNAFILAFNFWTLFTLLMTEMFIFRRETFLNNSLSVDDAFPSNNLVRPTIPTADGGYESIFDQHSRIASALRLSNRAVAASSKICSLTVCTNVSLSAAFILSQRSDGFRSVLSLISATMLIGTRFLTASFVCSAGVDNRGHASVSLYTKLHAVFNRLDEATDAESHIKGTPSGRLAGFGIEQFMAEEGENVLQLKQLPKTKAAVAGMQHKLIAILSVCTGSDVVRESQDADEDGGASAAPRKSDDIETGAEAAPTEEGARLGGEEEGEEPQREGRKCLPCGGARKEQPEAAAAAAEGEGEPAQ